MAFDQEQEDAGNRIATSDDEAGDDEPSDEGDRDAELHSRDHGRRAGEHQLSLCGPPHRGGSCGFWGL